MENSVKRAIGAETVGRIEEVASALQDMASLLETIKMSFTSEDQPSPSTSAGSVGAVERMAETLSAELDGIVDDIYNEPLQMAQ